MADDFKVGDVVVCVDASSPSLHVTMSEEDHEAVRYALKHGNIYKITEVFPNNTVRINAYWPLGYAGGYQQSRFKHLPKADDTFIQQMRSLKPARTKESAR